MPRAREAVREHLMTRVPEDSFEPLLVEGFVFGMVAQHEQQHADPRATLQLMTEVEYCIPARAAASLHSRGGVSRAGVHPRRPGASGHGRALGLRQRAAFHVRHGAFPMDAHPVTNGDYRAFVESGGYEDPR